MSGSITEDIAEDTSERTQKIPSDVLPVIDYVETCLEKLAKEGFFLVGEQGGRIYQSQGGDTPDWSDSLEGAVFLTYNNKRVPYFINLPVSCALGDTSVPDYPSDIFPYPYEHWIDPDTPDMTQLRYRLADCFGDFNSIDREIMLRDLSSYIQDNLDRCDLSSFRSFRINMTSASAEVIPLKDDTQVKLNYVIDLTNVNTGTRTRLTEFNAKIDLNLDKLINFSNDIMQEDVDDPNFDIRQSFDEFDVTVSQDVYNKDDLVSITSDRLILDGNQFKFSFARRNRYPVLEFVYDESFDSVILEVGNQTKYDEVIHQEFRTLDPDEDSVDVKVIVGPNKLNPHILTDTNPYTITFADVNTMGRVIVWINASDGQYADYQEFIIT
jgi:hypothetical protein